MLGTIRSNPIRFAIRLLLLLVFFVVCRTVRDNYLFEKYVETLNIGFQDMPESYAKALNESYASKGKGQDVEFDYPSVFSTSDVGSHIPHKIHFVWFANLYDSHLDVSDIPTHGSDAPKLCAKFNPDWEIKTWNATEARELIETHYKWFIPTYDAYRYPIQRVDAFKYFLLWHHGGVYMDLDIACRRSLEPLIQFPAWFPRASPLGVNNDLMAARAHHPAIGRMVESLKAYDRNYIFPYLTIFYSTGPSFTGSVLNDRYRDMGRVPSPHANDKAHADPDEWFVLHRDFYSEEYTFFGHRPGGTWHGGDVAFVLFFVDHPSILAVVVSLLIVGCILIRRKQRRLVEDVEAQSEWQNKET